MRSIDVLETDSRISPHCDDQILDGLQNTVSDPQLKKDIKNMVDMLPMDYEYLVNNETWQDECNVKSVNDCCGTEKKEVGCYENVDKFSSCDENCDSDMLLKEQDSSGNRRDLNLVKGSIIIDKDYETSKSQESCPISTDIETDEDSGMIVKVEEDEFKNHSIFCETNMISREKLSSEVCEEVCITSKFEQDKCKNLCSDVLANDTIGEFSTVVTEEDHNNSESSKESVTMSPEIKTPEKLKANTSVNSEGSGQITSGNTDFINKSQNDVSFQDDSSVDNLSLDSEDDEDLDLSAALVEENQNLQEDGGANEDSIITSFMINNAEHPPLNAFDCVDGSSAFHGSYNCLDSGRPSTSSSITALHDFGIPENEVMISSHKFSSDLSSAEVNLNISNNSASGQSQEQDNPLGHVSENPFIIGSSGQQKGNQMHADSSGNSHVQTFFKSAGGSGSSSATSSLSTLAFLDKIPVPFSENKNFMTTQVSSTTTASYVSETASSECHQNDYASSLGPILNTKGSPNSSYDSRHLPGTEDIKNQGVDSNTNSGSEVENATGFVSAPEVIFSTAAANTVSSLPQKSVLSAKSPTNSSRSVAENTHIKSILNNFANHALSSDVCSDDIIDNIADRFALVCGSSRKRPHENSSYAAAPTKKPNLLGSAVAIDPATPRATNVDMTDIDSPRLMSSARKSLREEGAAVLLCKFCDTANPGYKCIRCRNAHVMCQRCLEDEIRIVMASDKMQLSCPEDSCRSVIALESLASVISSFVVDLLGDNLRLKEQKASAKALRKMQGLVICPRCSCPGLLDDNLLHYACATCNSSSCRYCKAPWTHYGDHESCYLLGFVGTECFKDISKLPKNWDTSVTPFNRNFVEVNVPLNSNEGATVAAFFRTTSSSRTSVVQIFRLQNRKLWEKYVLKRRHVEEEIGAADLKEKFLFHGTKAENVAKICAEGFDIRVPTANGALLGKGIYFSTTARYSERYADKSGMLFLTRVVCGWSQHGQKQMTRPQYHEASKRMYDSCVDNLLSPTMYTVFDNSQCYPEYVIQFSQ